MGNNITTIVVAARTGMKLGSAVIAALAALNVSDK
ncbi:uncharacterized protein G2W53_002253 [Senna tora]|uniref:Uncharacterized protein n=1 Tax=Senna tora TaxID=362788 RepID=A0A834XH88_9FABA|nr:uncharacterized protein G2W53_002253 [Senna tora]